jgi:hypothetical protein
MSLSYASLVILAHIIFELFWLPDFCQLEVGSHFISCVNFCDDDCYQTEVADDVIFSVSQGILW